MELKINTEIRKKWRYRGRCSKWTRKKKKKITKWNRNKQPTGLRIQGNDDKYAYQPWEKKGWAQWELQWRVRKYKKEPIRTEE